jgi:hypothetical protein
MEKPNFEHKKLIEFLKSEFISRKKKNGFFGTIASFFQLFVFGTFNYQTKKSWNETYKSIENKLLNFYPELNCKFNGKRPTFIELLKNYGTERIEFKFDKAHIAVTNDSLYIFPFDSAELKDQGSYYNMLEEPFRIIYDPTEKKDKYSIISTVSEFISMKTENGKTNIVFKTTELNAETELIFDREITVANNVYNS